MPAGGRKKGATAPATDALVAFALECMTRALTRRQTKEAFAAKFGREVKENSIYKYQRLARKQMRESLDADIQDHRAYALELLKRAIRESKRPIELLKAVELYANLLGLNAPTKVDVRAAVAAGGGFEEVMRRLFGDHADDALAESEERRKVQAEVVNQREIEMRKWDMKLDQQRLASGNGNGHAPATDVEDE